MGRVGECCPILGGVESVAQPGEIGENRTTGEVGGIVSPRRDGGNIAMWARVGRISANWKDKGYFQCSEGWAIDTLR